MECVSVSVRTGVRTSECASAWWTSGNNGVVFDGAHFFSALRRAMSSSMSSPGAPPWGAAGGCGNASASCGVLGGICGACAIGCGCSMGCMGCGEDIGCMGCMGSMGCMGCGDGIGDRDMGCMGCMGMAGTLSMGMGTSVLYGMPCDAQMSWRYISMTVACGTLSDRRATSFSFTALSAFVSALCTNAAPYFAPSSARICVWWAWMWI